MSSYGSRLTMSKCLCHKSPKDKAALFVTVNVISPLPRCSSCLAPFCFMKNNNTHACIVSALSSHIRNPKSDQSGDGFYTLLHRGGELVCISNF